MRGPDLQQARRLELGLVLLRWLVVAYGVVQVVFAVRDNAELPRFVLPLAFALVSGLAAGNVLLAGMIRRSATERELTAIGLVASALDVAVVTGLIWTSGQDPADPVWVIGYLLPLEGAARFGLTGALGSAALYGGSELLREAYLSDRLAAYAFDWPAVGFRVGVCLVVGIVAGLFARSVTRQTERARERARTAEEALAREALSRRDLSAFHTALLLGAAAEDPHAGVQSIADAVGRELGCDALGVLLLEPGASGKQDLVAAGVFGDPGYDRGTRFVPGTEPLVGEDLSRPTLSTDPSEAVVPLRVSGETIGILHERSDEPGSIDRERLLVLGRLADQVALIVQTARLRARQQETVRRLRELDEMKTDFVAITSHELRTPLSAIRGFVNTLRSRGPDLPPEEAGEYLEIIASQTERLIRLVEDLFVVARFEAGQLVLQPEEVRVPDLLNEVRTGLGEAGPRVRIGGLDGAPGSITVDRQRLGQVLTNILQNALKFSPPGEPVTVDVSSNAPGTVTFAIGDRGPGIEPRERDRIFERFTQSESSATRTAEGAGLGLYIALQLTKAMGGWIDVESRPGVGSTFSVTIPTERPLQAPAPLSAGGRSG
jgi:signal transduction histidine kinase